MDSANYLASLTGYENPGRLCIVTKKVANDSERDEQALLAHEYLTLLHSHACQKLTDTYDKVVEGSEEWIEDRRQLFKDIFKDIKDCCYPYVSVPEKSIADVMSKSSLSSQAYGIRMPSIDHTLTVANPEVMRTYIQDQIKRTLTEGYTIEVGLSIVPIPILFALESCGVGHQPTLQERTEIVQSYFPMPNIAEIEDSFVDGTYKRRQSNTFINHEYQLFYSKFWYHYKKYLSRNEDGSPDHWKRKEKTSSWRLLFDSFAKKPRVDDLFELYPTSPRVERDVAQSRLALRYPKRLSYFDALRTDYSLARLRHYTHTSPEHFQRYILFTNYPKYVKRFVMRAVAEICRAAPERPCKLVIPEKDTRGVMIGVERVRECFTNEQIEYICRSAVSNDGPKDDPNPELRRSIERKIEEEFVSSDCQLPAYHFSSSEVDGARPRSNTTDQQYRESIYDEGPLPGISLVNIGVGASNARTITDHIAVLRPLCWIMVGHCGGLRNRQKLGDYVMANGYVRRDGVLDDEVPLDAPVHGTRVINFALQDATRYRVEKAQRSEQHAKGSDEDSSKEQFLPNRSQDVEEEVANRQIEVLESIRAMTRIGPVISVANRNWETSPTEDTFELFERYRVVAVDMESAALAANAYRYRIPHGTFLCVSDKPLHGAIKMRFFADEFYRSQIDRHLDLAMDAIKWLNMDLDGAIDLLNARELRGIDDPPWR